MKQKNPTVETVQQELNLITDKMNRKSDSSIPPTTVDINSTDSLDLTCLKIYATQNVAKSFEIKNGRKTIYFFATKQGELLRVWKNGKETKVDYINLLQHME